MIRYIIAHWERIRTTPLSPLRHLLPEDNAADDKCSAASRCVWDLENEA